MAIAESTHWYHQDGKPQYTVVGANGKERNATLRDARKLQLVPSVTSIIGVAAKPGLENWKINQALLSALTLPMYDDEPLDAFMARARQDAKEQVIKAAERGTAIHADIEEGFSTGVSSVAYSAVRSAIDELYPGASWVAEDSRANSNYGGKIDLYSPDAHVVVDFKTKDGLGEGTKPEKLVYDEHGMQLSAYAMLLGFPDPDRVSVFVDRENPQVVKVHQWEHDSHGRHCEMFMALCRYWQLTKNYTPTNTQENGNEQ